METPNGSSSAMPSPAQPAAPSLMESIKKDWSELSGELWSKKEYIAKAAVVAGAFWLVQFAYQYFVLVPGELNGALVRSFALSGATLIGLALCIGPIAYLKPEWNFVEYRRTVGVSGFFLVYMHVFAVISAYFGGNPLAIYFELNPFKNPIIFGSAALWVFVALMLTSTDWAVSKLGFRNWKALHRLIYPAFVLSVLHFTQINPELLYNPAGYLLLAASLAAMGFQLAGFAKKVQSGKAGAGTWIGGAFTIAALALLAIAFFFKNNVA